MIIELPHRRSDNAGLIGRLVLQTEGSALGALLWYFSTLVTSLSLLRIWSVAYLVFVGSGCLASEYQRKLPHGFVSFGVQSHRKIHGFLISGVQNHREIHGFLTSGFQIHRTIVGFRTSDVQNQRITHNFKTIAKYMISYSLVFKTIVKYMAS